MPNDVERAGEVRPINSRSRSRAWFGESDLWTPPRRDDMFVVPEYAEAVLSTAKAAATTVHMDWMALEYDEFRERDIPVQRKGLTGIAVIGLADHYPLGWVIIAHPIWDHALTVSLDVITDIGIEL